MSGVPFNSARPILPQGAQPPAGGLTLEQLLASMR
jgi:hypothetical protein